MHQLLENAGRKTSIGAIYTTLDRLEKKGFVTSAWGEPTSERGGRRKRDYSIAAPGQHAVKVTIEDRERSTMPLGAFEGA